MGRVGRKKDKVKWPEAAQFQHSGCEKGLVGMVLWTDSDKSIYSVSPKRKYWLKDLQTKLG